MNQTIEFHRKYVYGVKRLYPVCARAVALCNLIDAPTIQDYNLQLVSELGFDILITGLDEEKIEATK